MQNKIKDLEHDLLGSLLDDDQQLTPKNNKSNQTSKRIQAFSAPPVFLDFDLKINYQLLDTFQFDSPDPEDRNIIKAFSNKRTQRQQSAHHIQPQTSFRKMSCDTAMLNYYDSPQNVSFDYFQYSSVMTPEQQLLKNPHKAIEWAKDQNGSRAVQNIFDSDNIQNKDILFNNLIKDFKQLMKDRFGNYVFQKIVEKGTIEHKQILLNALWGEILQLSFHGYGCRVVQKSIQFISDKKEKQEQFMEEIIPSGLLLMQNQNGNHVIQKCIQTFPHNVIEPLADIIIAKLKQMPYDSYGCRVVQKYLQNHRGNEKCEYVLKELLKEAVSLSQCQYGNYVMQHIVTKCQQERKKVYELFLQKIVQLSINKFASNVVEKAIQAIRSNFCDILSDWFLKNHKQMVILSKHQYGNYVIQSMFEKVSKEKKTVIKGILKQNTIQISKSQYGRHVLMQLDKLRNK